MRAEDIVVGSIIGGASFFGGLLLSCHLKSCPSRGDIEVDMVWSTMSASTNQEVTATKPITGIVTVADAKTGTKIGQKNFLLNSVGEHQILSFPNLPFGDYSIMYESDIAGSEIKLVKHHQPITRVSFYISPVPSPLTDGQDEKSSSPSKCGGTCRKYAPAVYRPYASI